MVSADNLINFLRPSGDSSESLYKQLSRSLNSAIQEGILKPGDALMPERDLASNLKMSRITVRKAIDQLVEIGMLIKRQGAGTVVSENVDLVLHKNLASLNSFTADMKKRGLESYSRITLREEGKATAKEALIMNLNEDDFVHRLNRVRYLVNEPLLYEIAVIPASIISITSAIDNSLYELLESKKMNLNGAETQVMTYEANLSNRNLKFYQYIVVKNEKAFVLTYSAEVERFELYLQETKKIKFIVSLAN